jgi:Flp pilus assembly pilin Flp
MNGDPMQSIGNEHRLRGDTGATMTEYAVVAALLLVVSIGAIKFLQAGANKQINLQADCVSTRPPPVSCQVPAIQTTTTVSVAPTTPTVPPASGTSSFNTGATYSAATGAVSTSVTVKTGAGVVMPGATVTVHWTASGCSLSGYAGPVTTDAAGRATFTTIQLPASPPATCTGLTISVTRIDPNPSGTTQVVTLPSNQVLP